MAFGEERQTLVADIGRTSIRVALADQEGRLKLDSIREYEPSTQPTVSSALAAFGTQAGLRSLPKNAAIAVAGVARGDTVSVTNSRWILSRSGLTSMFQAPPLILNDFAASAWALSEPGAAQIEPLGNRPLQPTEPGTYCIVGMGSGLGVAVISRDEHGFVTVLPTEAGHMGFMDGLNEVEAVIGKLRRGASPVCAEMLLSESGLSNIHSAMGEISGRSTTPKAASEILNSSRMRSDPAVAAAGELFVKALWHYAGNIVLAYGAWDGVLFVGPIAEELRATLRNPNLSRHFALDGPYARRLKDVPAATASMSHAALRGAAVALRMERARREASSLFRKAS